MVLGKRAFLGQRLELSQTATTGLDFELAALGFSHDEVL